MKYIKLLCLFVFLLFQKAAAQDVIVTVQVLPPYSTYLPDYLNNPSKIVFTLMSSQTRDVKIRATITGDNGITVATSASGSAAAPIHLVANQIKMMNGTNLKAYLDVNSVSVSGINKNDLYRGNGLPEGSYTFCLQVLDYQTGQPLSQPAPTGCSNPINIMQINPPTLIAPVCEANINGTTPQNMIFTWLPAPGVAPGTQYRLKIVELVPNSRNPNEAMNSATTPAFFETTTNAFSFFYGPAQPPLKDGKKYAWRVTALNSGSNSKSNFQNNGNSEVCGFVYQKTAVAQTGPASYGINLIKPTKDQKVYNGYGVEFQWSASDKANLAGYELQFTNSYNQNDKITNWTSIPENLFSTKDAWMASKTVGKMLTTQLPGSWTNGIGKIAWRIRGYDINEKSVDSSRIQVYELVEAPTADRIKLVSPIQGKKIVQGYGMKYEWESSKKSSVTKYQLQFTDRYSQETKINDWNNIPDKLFSHKSASYASKDTKDLYVDMDPMWTTATGKIAWRVVGISYGFVVDSSKIETFEIIEDTSEMAKLKGFMMGGYYVAVKTITTKDENKLAGSGTITLWENGKQLDVYFKDLKVRPFAFIPKTQQKQWVAIAGEMDVEVYKKLYGGSKFMLQTATGCDGTFQANLNTMKITANVEGTLETATGFFKITNDLSHTEGRIVGKWFTNFFIPKPGQNWSNQLYEFESAETSVKMSWANKFDGTVILKNDKRLEGMGNGLISVDFGPADLKLNLKGLNGELDLSGTVTVPNAAPTADSGESFTNLQFKFQNRKNMNFPVKLDQPVKWQMNKDGSVWANVSEFYVHLSGTGEEDEKFKNYPDGLNFDKFNMLINLPKKTGSQTATSINLTFNNVYNNGKGYTNNKKGEADIKDAVEIAGFPAKLKKSDFLLNKNKLVFLYVQGNIYVPFINDWSPIGLDIDSEKIQNIYVDFDYEKKYFLNKNGGLTYITLSAGRLENSSIVISPKMHIDNNEHEGVEVKDYYMCDMFINPEGSVSFNNNFASNTESVCEGTKKWAKYFNFDFGIDKVKIKRNSVKTDAQFMFTGDIILSEGIASTSKKESGFLYHGKAPNPGVSMPETSGNNNGYQYNNNTPVQAPPKIPKGVFGPVYGGDFYEDADSEVVENTVEWTDDKKAIQGGYEDGGQKFGGGFKLVQNDPTWGDYFELGGSYETKEPSAKQLEAKLILGKKKNANYYSYWFFSFYQKGIVAVPIVPGVVEAYGFGGKAYYHMQVDYDNMGNISNMAPNNQFSLGIAATADVRTAFDQGALIHGKATITMQFEGLGLSGIKYYVNGTAIAPSSDSEGLLSARMNGQLNWVDKYIDGHGQIWGGIKKIVCLNEGAANEDSIGFHFGADDFYINVGSPEVPVTAEIMCGNGFSTGVWFNFSKTDMGFGFQNDYDSGWKGLNLGVASAKGRLTSSLGADINVHYSPFQATGTASFSGRAYGRGCVKWVGCIGGSCGVGANLTVSMPDPVVFAGSVRCDVSRWIPDFTLHASWSSDSGFSISL
jgi:TANFOR domain-containing protein